MKYLIPIVIVGFLFSCQSPKPREPVVKQSGHFIEESASRNKKLLQKEEKQIKAIISKDTAHHYKNSSQGFWYRYDKRNKEDTLTPTKGDLVTFNYDISTLDGKPIYSTSEIGKRQYKVDKENVFTGLRQGLKLMKEGETLTFYFPSYKAFGYYGDNDKIGRNQAIKSTITLRSIKIREDTMRQKPFKN